MGKIKDILELLEKGYVPYSCEPPDRFYQKRGCRRKDKAEWFMRPRPKPGEAVRCACLGCRKRCVVVNPRSWSIVLDEAGPSRPGMVIYSQVERITVDELLRIKRVLRVEEAAWALSVSRQKIYHWLDEGLLEQVPGSPLRVTSASVDRILQPERRAG